MSFLPRRSFGAGGAAVGLLLAAMSAGCSAEANKGRYLLAERLWTDGNYAAAVTEFEKVVQRDPKGKLGLQALYRAATTESLYLSRNAEAVRRFRDYVELAGETPQAWEAEKQIGEILFARSEQYEQAIQHYRRLMAKRPGATEQPEFLWRIGRSHFFLLQFDDAIFTYQEIRKRFPGTDWAEKAAFEVAVSWFTRGEQRPAESKSGKDSFNLAMAAYQDFIRTYPGSTRIPEARFGIAFCLEELDQLDAAYKEYEALKASYPSPQVIEIKLARIRERKAQKSH